MPRGLGTTLYLALGWIASISVIAVWRRRGFRSIGLVLAGGIAYSVGAILLGLKWPTIIPRVFGPHELWHIAVIVGLGLHWRFVDGLTRDHRAGTSRKIRTQRKRRPHEVERGPMSASVID